jgi:ferrous iron transport protein A
MTSSSIATAASGAALIGLHDLPRGVEAEIVDLVPAAAAEDQVLRLRLLEIGFLPGEVVRVIACGHPGADPLAVRVGHTTFALRRHEASLVRVRAGRPA